MRVAALPAESATAAPASCESVLTRVPCCPGGNPAPTAVRRMVETHFYWALLHSRFVEPSGWTFTRSNIFNDMPGCIKAMIVP